jgi:hypothetical protein
VTSQDLTFELFYDGAWHDITSDDDVFTQPIVIKRGQGDETPQLRPASVALQLANDDDRYRTSNPVSPLYGKAGLNTPARVSVGGTVRAVVEASSWSADQSRDFRRTPRRGRAWVDFEGGGLLQRIGQWDEPLRSPMYRQITSLATLRGYWPGEDAAAATAMSSGYPGGSPAAVSDVTFGSGDGPAGSEKLIVLGSAGLATGAFPADIDPTAWQLSFTTDLAGADGTERQAYIWRTSQGYYWVWQASLTTFRLTVVDSTGATLLSSGIGNGGVNPGQKIVFRMKCTLSAGTWTVEPAWYSEGSPVVVGYTDTFAGTAGKPTGWKSTANTVMSGAFLGHVFATTTTADNLHSGEMIGAINGHSPENARNRFGRLMNELGLPWSVIGVAADSTLMGPQSADPFPEQLKEIAATEDGLIFDDVDGIGLVLMLRNARYNQTPALTLHPSDLPGLPAELTDDLGVHNIVTAKQRGGGEATARDDTSRKGTQPPPDGVGEARETVDVNLSDPDTQLPQEANWWLRRFTVDLPRFPQVTVNLGALDPATIAQVDTVDVGSVIEIVGAREYTIRLYVLGYVETIRPADQGRVRRTIVFTCAPDQQFQVGVWDAAEHLWDARTTTLKDAADSSATSVTFRSTSSKSVWSTSTPYDVVIAGQRNRVTAMGAPSLVSGAYEQPATLARGVDGITKPLPAGEPIRIVIQGRWALR